MGSDPFQNPHILNFGIPLALANQNGMSFKIEKRAQEEKLCLLKLQNFRKQQSRKTIKSFPIPLSLLSLREALLVETRCGAAPVARGPPGPGPQYTLKHSGSPFAHGLSSRTFAPNTSTSTAWATSGGTARSRRTASSACGMLSTSVTPGGSSGARGF